jgi:hypothetical protein
MYSITRRPRAAPLGPRSVHHAVMRVRIEIPRRARGAGAGWMRGASAGGGAHADAMGHDVAWHVTGRPWPWLKIKSSRSD